MRVKRSKENDEWINSQQRNLLQDSLQDPSAITLDQIKAICSLEKIIESEPKDSVFGEILKFLLLKSRARYSFPMAYKRLPDIISGIETLQKTKHWDTLVSFVSLLWELWKKDSEYEVQEKNRKQTHEATEAKKFSGIKEYVPFFEIEPLMDQLSQVDETVHKKDENGRFKHRNNIKSGVNRFYRKNQEKIDAILNRPELKEKQKQLNPGVSNQEFFQIIFHKFTELYILFRGCTACGYVPEKRAPRSEESRKRSSQGALNALKRKTGRKMKRKKVK